MRILHAALLGSSSSRFSRVWTCYLFMYYTAYIALMVMRFDLHGSLSMFKIRNMIGSTFGPTISHPLLLYRMESIQFF